MLSLRKLRRNLYRRIPSKLKYDLISHYKNFFSRKGGVYYGHRAEDVVLRSPLRKQKGFYVDVGAYHPFWYNNTYLFYKKGWRGINIDANPKCIKFFNTYRKRDINLNLGVSEVSGQLTYYSFAEPAYSTFVKEEYERVIRENDSEFIEEISITCKPLSEIFDEYVEEGTEIDLLDIDVQGNDFEVLKSNNWSTYQPKVILIESLDFDINNPKDEEIYQFLIPKGYRFYAYDHLNLIFTKL